MCDVIHGTPAWACVFNLGSACMGVHAKLPINLINRGPGKLPPPCLRPSPPGLACKPAATRLGMCNLHCGRCHGGMHIRACRRRRRPLNCVLHCCGPPAMFCVTSLRLGLYCVPPFLLAVVWPLSLAMHEVASATALLFRLFAYSIRLQLKSFCH